jgi:transcriptional regulator with XRE-family HTH domain
VSSVGLGDREGWSNGYRLEWGEVVGHRIRRLRQARGWALRDLRDRVPKPDGGRYSGGYFSRVERGWTSPPMYVYIRLAEAFEIAPGELLGREEFDLALTREQQLLLDVVERLGLKADEAIVRLARPATPDG